MWMCYYCKNVLPTDSCSEQGVILKYRKLGCHERVSIMHGYPITWVCNILQYRPHRKIKKYVLIQFRVAFEQNVPQKKC